MMEYTAFPFRAGVAIQHCFVKSITNNACQVVCSTRCYSLCKGVVALCIETVWHARRLFRFPPREAVAAMIMASQKTMPFAVSIISLLPANLGSKGLLTLPPLICQVSQLFCDIWIANYFGKLVSAICDLLHSSEASAACAHDHPSGAFRSRDYRLL